MSGNLRKIWSLGYCVHTALNTSFALLSQLKNRRQLCVCLASKVSCLAGEPDVYILYYYNFSAKNHAYSILLQLRMCMREKNHYCKMKDRITDKTTEGVREEFCYLKSHALSLLFFNYVHARENRY